MTKDLVITIDYLKFMQKSGMVVDIGMLIDCEGVHTDCQHGKLQMTGFSSVCVRQVVRKFEFINTDICGPLNVESLNKNRYFLLFIDNYTRMTRVYILSNKIQVLYLFKKFKPSIGE